MSGRLYDRAARRAAMSGTGRSGKALCVVAVWFGAGLFPFAPGTAGTIAALPLILLAGFLGTGGKIIMLGLLTGLAVWSSDFYSRRVGVKDPSEVVVDEVAGFFAAMAFWELSWFSLLAGFILFRFFDILKPFPARRAERLPGGIGIVADDLVAGGYTALCLWGFYSSGLFP